MIYECSRCKIPCIHIVCRDTTINSIPDEIFTSDLKALSGFCCLCGTGEWGFSYSEDYDE